MQLRIALVALALLLLGGFVAIGSLPHHNATAFEAGARVRATATVQHVFLRDCATCHGPSGAGDGPGARAFSPPPPDLRAHHATLHTAGDLYWWITHGRRAMPAFGHLESTERWNLEHKAEATIQVGGGTLHAEQIEPNMYAAIDILVDKLDRQVKKHKEKLTDHHAKEVARYRDRATFLMVYVREAHPTDGWQMESNDRVGV